MVPRARRMLHVDEYQFRVRRVGGVRRIGGIWGVRGVRTVWKTRTPTVLVCLRFHM